VIDELPSGDTGDMVPVVLPMIAVRMVPNGIAGIAAIDDIVVLDGVIVVVLPAVGVEAMLDTVTGVGTGAAVMEGGGGAGTTGGGAAGTFVPGIVDKNDVAGCADSGSIGAVALLIVDVEEVAGAAGVVGAAEADAIVPVVLPNADEEVTGTAGVPGPICPVGIEQVTAVPGVVGSEASGSGASVVSGVPGWVVAENGLGPLSGDVTIVPGVDERPMAVLPMVETCARQALPACQQEGRCEQQASHCHSSLRAALTCLRFANRDPCCPPPGSPSD